MPLFWEDALTGVNARMHLCRAWGTRSGGRPTRAVKLERTRAYLLRPWWASSCSLIWREKKCLCWKGLLLRMISHVCGSCSEWVTTCVWSCSRWHVFVEPSPVHSFQTVISSGWVMSCVDWSCPRLPLFDQPVFWPASLFGSLLFSTTDLVRASPFDQPVCLAVYCLVLLTLSGPPPLTSQSVWQCYWSYQPHPTPTPLDQPVCLAVLLILSAPSPPPPLTSQSVWQ